LPFPLIFISLERFPVTGEVLELPPHLPDGHIGQPRQFLLDDPPLVIVISDANGMRRSGCALLLEQLAERKRMKGANPRSVACFLPKHDLEALS
jgi:hypothetical protein